jgi:hypothetical protein
MLNKAMQLRQRVPNEIRIVFFPLRSLVNLYSNISAIRQQFQSRFTPENFHKLLGIGLTKQDLSKLEKDPRYEAYSKLKGLDVNAVLIVESLVDVFLDDVINSSPLENSFVDFLIDTAKRASSRA